MKTLRKLRDIAKVVAPLLPGGYVLAPKDKREGDSDKLSKFGWESCRLTRTKTFTEGKAPVRYVIQLSNKGNWGTIQVEGQWPRSRFHSNKIYPDEQSEPRPATTVGRDTAPDEIAKKIQLFLPTFEKAFKLAIEDRDIEDAKELASRRLQE
jgi:hypothetical protein